MKTKQAHDAGYVLSEETLNAYGAFDDKLRELESGATAAKNALGTALLPALTELSTDGVEMLSKFTKAVKDANGDLPTMIDNIGRLLPEAADRLAEYVPGAVELIGKALQAAVGGISDNLDPFLDVASDLVVSILSQTAELLPELISSIGDLAVDLVKGIFDSNAIGGIASAAISAIGKLIAQIIEALPGILKGLESFFSTSAPQIFSALLGAVKIIVESLSKNAPAIIRELSPLIQSIIKFIFSAITGLTPMISELIGDVATELIPGIIESVSKAIPEIISGIIAELARSTPDLTAGTVELLGEVIFKAVPAIILAIADIIPNLIRGMIEAFSGADDEDKFGGVGKSWGESMMAGFGEKIKEFFADLPEMLLNLVKNTAFFNLGEILWDKMLPNWRKNSLPPGLAERAAADDGAFAAEHPLDSTSGEQMKVLLEQKALLERIADKDTTHRLQYRTKKSITTITSIPVSSKKTAQAKWTISSSGNI